jgi:LysR family transcriptional regulator, glycine cleavage system transcriptional activator
MTACSSTMPRSRGARRSLAPGIGLLSLPDAVEDTRAGLLVAPFGTDALAAMPADRVPGFYLVVLRARRRLQAVAAFCDWVTGEDWSSDPQQCTEEACS